MRKRSVRKDFTLFGNATLLYMKRCIEEVSTPEERWCCCWLRWCLFNWCPRTNVHSSSTPRRMRLSLLAFSEHKRPYILRFPAHCGWCAVRHFSGGLPTFELARKRYTLGLNARRSNCFWASESNSYIVCDHHSHMSSVEPDRIVGQIQGRDGWRHFAQSSPDNYEFRIFENNDEMRNEALVLIEDMCVLMCSSLLSTLGMPAPNRSMHDAFNCELQQEQDYDRDEQAERVRKNMRLLNCEQKNVYDSLIKVVDDGTGGIYFLDAPGETGKTFVISLILATIRSRSQIALVVASSGIAATFLEGGRTAHSALELPMNLLTVDKPTWTMTKNSATARLVRECKIIIWDECTMAHKRALEAVHRTMKDLRGDSRPFGGAMILLSGDFRQTLPVIPKSTAADELNACLKSSSLWRHVKKLKLTTNMRVAMQNDPLAAEFSRQLLALGYGQIPVYVSTGLILVSQLFASSHRRRRNSSPKSSPALHKIIKISIGLVNGQY